MTITIPVTVTGESTGAIAFSQGAKTPDFAITSGACVGTYTAGTGSCTVSVAFQPQYPGQRLGAVQITTATGKVLGQTLLTGTGQGSLAVLKPGRIDTVAGSGDWIFRGDGVLAILGQIFLPTGIVSDASGNLFLSDSSNNRIRRVDAGTGVITSVAGNGIPGYSGDSGNALSASISSPAGLVLDGADDVIFVDSGNHCVRRVDASTNVITVVAGVCGVQGYSGDGDVATKAKMSLPEGLAMGPDGSLYIADTGNERVRKVAPDGTITTVAGTGVAAYSGDNDLATKAQLWSPWGIALGGDGSLYIADLSNNRVRKVDPSGMITTVAGDGNRNFKGDDGDATLAELSAPAAVAVDPAGNIYIGDSGNNRVREVSVKTGKITSIVGGMSESFEGDGGPADKASLYGPYGLFFDQTGQLLIADMFHNRIRRVTATGVAFQYATIRAGKVSPPQTAVFENDGNVDMTVDGFTKNLSALDPATTTCVAGTLPIGVACTLGVEFAPTDAGDMINGSLTVNSDAGNSPTTVLLSGQVLTVNPTSVAVISSQTPSLVNTVVTFTATVSSSDANLDGTIDFLEGTTVLCKAVALVGKSATCPTSFLTAGTHNITASYTGDTDNAAATSLPFPQVVQQTSSVLLTATPNPSIITSPVSLVAVVTASTGTPTGTVTFYDNGNLLETVALTLQGTASYSTSKLLAATHTLTANYSGDTLNAAAVSPNVTQVVNLASTVTTLGVDNADVTVGTTVTYTANVASTGGPTPTGNVDFLEDTKVLGTVKLVNAVAVFPISTLSPGKHSIKAHYLGDTDNDLSLSSSLATTVEQIKTTTLVGSDINPAHAGAIVTLTATVNPVAGSTPDGAVTGTVTFSDEVQELGKSTVDSNGRATFQVSNLSVDKHTITASYSGDTNYVSSTSTGLTQTIQATASTTVLSANGSGLAGKEISLSATVTTSTGVPTGSVNFMDGKDVLGSGTLDGLGRATLSTTKLSVGNHSLTAVYVGDSNYTTSTSLPVPQLISLAVPSLTLAGTSGSINVGIVANFTAVLASSGVTPTGTITLMDGATPLMSKPAAANVAFSTSTLPFGTHTLTVSYDGDVNTSNAVSNALTVVVQQGSTTTSLQTTKTPQTLGQPLTLNASVSSTSPDITGNVSFFDGATLIGSSAVVNGTASLTTSSLTFGSHTLTATYSGDTNHTGSTSPALTERIVEAVNIGLSSNKNPAVSGASVTFSIRVSGNASVAATGPVTLLDGTSLLATETLDGNGLATFSTNTLAVASHAITATYPGDQNYSAATSTVLTQTIINADTQITLKASANPATFGTPVTLQAAVTSNGGIATGSIVFLDGSAKIGIGILDGTGIATVTTSTLAPGVHNIVASYEGDGKASASVSPPLSLAVRQTTSISVASSANPTSTLSPVTFTAMVTNAGQDVPAGELTFTDGSTTLGTVTLDANGRAMLTMPQLSAQSHSIVASYAGNVTNFASASPALTEAVGLRPTTTVLTASADPNDSQQVTLIAVVRYTGPVAPSGSVTFLNGSATVGTATVDSTGVATLTIRVGLSGETLTATYSGDDAYATSTSDPTSIGPESSPQFTFTLNPSSVTMPTGEHVTSSLTLTSPASFADTIQFGCLGLPASATCTFSTTQQGLKAGGSLSVQLTVDTGNPLGSGAKSDARVGALALLPGGLLAGVMAFCLRRRKKFAVHLALLAAVAIIFSTTGCGGLQVKTTPAGKYTFQVTARGQNTGVEESQPMTLTVTQ